jgi:hypothetical protein
LPACPAAHDHGQFDVLIVHRSGRSCELALQFTDALHGEEQADQRGQGHQE